MANKRQPKGLINAKGNQVYDPPIRIVSQEDLRNYGITWDDCETLYVGGIEPMKVYMYETDDPKLADTFWKEINVEHHRNCWSTRCFVPGTLKPLIVYPECNKCSECPYGKKNEYRQPRVINYDDPEELMNNEGEEFSEMNEAESEMFYGELIAAMNRKNPLIAEVFVRFHTYDLSAPEIAAELGIDKRTVYYLKEQGEQIRDRLMNR